MTRSKEELINELAKFGSELSMREKIASISEHEGLKIAFDEMTSKCIDSVKCKKYKMSKDQIKGLEILNNFIVYLEQQKEKISTLKALITECKEELSRYGSTGA